MKALSLLTALVILSVLAGSAQAYVFVPSDPDLQDLPHEKYFKWGINWSIPAGQEISTASVTFHDIYNWESEANDRLWLHLLDEASLGVHSGYDNEASGTWFAPPRYNGPQILLNEFADLPEGYSHRADVTYTFDAAELATLNSYAQNGNFGLGFDPDCHYYNCGIELKLETDENRPPVPEPGTFALLGLGLAGLVGGMARRRAAKG